MHQVSRGGKSVFGFQWMQLAWPKEYTQKDIVAKELLPIVSSCAVWDHYCQAAMWNSNVIPSRLWTQSTSVHFRSPWLCTFYDAWGFSQPILCSINISAWEILALWLTTCQETDQQNPSLHLSGKYPSATLETGVTKVAGLYSPLLSMPLQARYE